MPALEETMLPDFAMPTLTWDKQQGLAWTWGSSVASKLPSSKWHFCGRVATPHHRIEHTSQRCDQHFFQTYWATTCGPKQYLSGNCIPAVKYIARPALTLFLRSRWREVKTSLNGMNCKRLLKPRFHKPSLSRKSSTGASAGSTWAVPSTAACWGKVLHSNRLPFRLQTWLHHVLVLTVCQPGTKPSSFAQCTQHLCQAKRATVKSAVFWFFMWPISKPQQNKVDHRLHKQIARKANGKKV